MNPMNQISHPKIDRQRVSTRQSGRQPSVVDRSLKTVLTSIAPLPSSAVFVGLAEDGLPVLLDLRNPLPGPLLVAADAGAGKTRLLQTVARGIERLHDPAHVRFAVISEHPHEWEAFEYSQYSDGILEFHHSLTTGYLYSCNLRASMTTVQPSPLVLLIDGLEALFSDGDLRDSAHALLTSPAPRDIFPLVTFNTSAGSMPAKWLDEFRIRLLGYIRDKQAAAAFCAPGHPLPADMQPPCQFAARNGGSWLPFWLPELD